MALHRKRTGREELAVPPVSPVASPEYNGIPFGRGRPWKFIFEIKENEKIEFNYFFKKKGTCRLNRELINRIESKN